MVIQYGSIPDPVTPNDNDEASDKMPHELLNVEPSFYHHATLTKKARAKIHYDRTFIYIYLYTYIFPAFLRSLSNILP